MGNGTFKKKVKKMKNSEKAGKESLRIYLFNELSVKGKS